MATGNPIDSAETSASFAERAIALRTVGMPKALNTAIDSGSVRTLRCVVRTDSIINRAPSVSGTFWPDVSRPGVCSNSCWLRLYLARYENASTAFSSRRKLGTRAALNLCRASSTWLPPIQLVMMGFLFFFAERITASATSVGLVIACGVNMTIAPSMSGSSRQMSRAFS